MYHPRLVSVEPDNAVLAHEASSDEVVVYETSNSEVRLRQWATRTLLEHLVRGCTLNECRLAEYDLGEARETLDLTKNHDTLLLKLISGKIRILLTNNDVFI